MTPAERRELAGRFVPLALRLARQRWRSGLELDELRAAACLGLVIAARDFDPDRGAWVSFARVQIRRAPSAAVAGTRVVRLPEAVRRKLRDVVQARRAFVARHGREPDRAELAAAAGVPLHYIEALASTTVSLDAPLRHDEDGGRDMHAVLPDLATSSPADRVSDREVREVVEELPTFERDVVRARWLAEDDAPLLELAQRLGASTSAIYVTERRGLRRLSRSLR